MVSDWLCKTGLIWGLGLGPMATAQDPRYRKRPPLRMASVDQGYANRVGFPSSLSLEPNGHISASCHCHPLSIRSGLAPSSRLLRRAKFASQKALDHLPHTWPMVCRMSWTGCLSLSLKEPRLFCFTKQSNKCSACSMQYSRNY